MTPHVSLLEEIQEATGERVTGSEPAPGGDINEALRCNTKDGTILFVKTNDRAPPQLFQTEADGLQWLRNAGALPVPEVVAVSNEGNLHQFLVLTWIEPARRQAHFDVHLGHGLAALHQSGAPRFGYHQDNFIGTLPQPNAPCPTWVDFFRRRRLTPQTKLATDRARLPARTLRKLQTLSDQLEQWIDHSPMPHRVHGDLWGGNVHVNQAGEPVLIDPAVYGGDREMDLAMMKLFGGFSDAVFHAYDEALPRQAGWQERMDLYQLYPLLVHANLFGGSYANSVDRIVSRFV